MSLQDCRLVQLPKIADPRGNLTFVENGKHIPMNIKRVFYLYDVPGGETRAGHALKTCYQFVVAASGSFDVILTDGDRRSRYHLNRSYYGLFITPMVWRELDNFSTGSVCLVLASDYYDELDYYRDFNDYLVAVNNLSKI